MKKQQEKAAPSKNKSPYDRKMVRGVSKDIITNQAKKAVLERAKFMFPMRPRKVLYSKKVKGVTLKAIAGTEPLTDLGDPRQYESYRQKENAAVKTETDNTWSCRIVPHEVDIVSRRPLMFANNLTKLYLGAIYDYKSFADEDCATFPYKRKPITITTSAGHTRTPSVTVNSPDSAAINNGVGKIRNSMTKKVNEVVYGEKFKVLSEQDLMIRTGGGASFMGISARHDIDYKSKSKSHKYFLEFYQVYYTIRVNDDVYHPNDFFYLKSQHPNDPKALDDNKVDPNWAYVDSVTYGRMIQVMFESDWSFESVGIDINASLDWLFAKGDAYLTYREKEILDRTWIKAFVIGGDTNLAAKIMNATNLKDLHKRIDEYKDGRDDEVPIAFSLRTLDQRTVGAHLFTDFSSKECTLIAQRYEVTWENIFCGQADDGGSDDTEELHAWARIIAVDGNNNYILDTRKINQGVNLMAQAKRNVKDKRAKDVIHIPPTFSQGTRNRPIYLNTRETHKIGKKIIFNMNPQHSNARIAIRVGATEFDSWPNPDDIFTEARWEQKISEISPGTIELIASHERSRLHFRFTVRPVY